MAMEETPVWKLLIRLSAPVMLALLIQSIYNIVDSYFVARYSAEGLAALFYYFSDSAANDRFGDGNRGRN